MLFITIITFYYTIRRVIIVLDSTDIPRSVSLGQPAAHLRRGGRGPSGADAPEAASSYRDIW